ncbi:MAG: acyltransferase family protein [Deltaproteobacteria bacterium]|nr:acyltransferase family protein [Deltaproteobacteria bacterium]
MPFPPYIARAITRFLGKPDVLDRVDRLHFADSGHGFDTFGLSPDFVGMGDAVVSPLYEKYFRVRSHGAENIPRTGPGIVASNHSGTLPFDGMMLWADVLRNSDPPRIPRPIADYFVPSLPIIGTLFARCGMVGGSRGNARALLEAGELLMIFPEGTPGISKPFSERYKVQEWRMGHCELAIRHRAPVIPVGIVGPEEQMPQIAAIPFPGPIPYLPIPATLVPLPVRYHIYYGDPVRLDTEYDPSDADDPDAVREAALKVKARVQALLDKGLEEREGIFR